MTTPTLDTHLSPVVNEPKQILHGLKTSTADCTSMIETDFPALFARIRYFNDLHRDNIDVPPEKAVYIQVKDESENEATKNETSVPQSDSVSRSGQSELTH